MSAAIVRLLFHLLILDSVLIPYVISQVDEANTLKPSEFGIQFSKGNHNARDFASKYRRLAPKYIMGTWLILDIISYVSLDLIGIPGNLIILFAFLHTFHSQGKVTTGEIILSKLALSNLLVILTWGLPITLQATGTYMVFGDLSCQISLYFYCVGRAMSVSITSLLGCFQCISITPSHRRWLRVKRKLLDHLFTLMLFLWTFNLIISSTRLAYSRASIKNVTSKYIMSYNFCFVIFPNYLLYIGNGIIYVVRDLFFLTLMMLSSGYLLHVFYQHGKQVKCIPMLNIKHAEMRAAKAVFTLVMMYIVSFGLDNLFWILTLCTFPLSPRFTDARIFFDSCYSAISPIVIILTNRKIQMGLQCSRKKRDLQVVKTISNYAARKRC